MKNILISVFAFCLFSCTSNYSRDNQGVTVNITKNDSAIKAVRLKVINDDIIRVTASPRLEVYEEQNLIDVSENISDRHWTVKEKDGEVVLETATLRAHVCLENGKTYFTDLRGKVLLNELSASVREIQLENKTAYTIQQTFQSSDDEAFYGLGQHQGDVWNYKGKNESLFQYNTKVSIPFVVSSKGYGVLWNNYSYSKFGDPREYKNLEQFKLFDKSNRDLGLTAIYTTRDGRQVVRQESILDYETNDKKRNLALSLNNVEQVVWEGTMQPNETGVHQFRLTYSGYISLEIDDKLIVPERWRRDFIPNNNIYLPIDMRKDKMTKIKITWKPNGGAFFGLKALSPRTEDEKNMLSLWSEAADNIDYYFINGNKADDAIKGYRTITGKAPIMPKWALGFWQSRERYQNQFDVIDVLKEYRKRQIPIDNIVQDWHFWSDGQWGSHEFDAQRFPRPQAMIDSVHALDARIMFTVWPKFYKKTDHYTQFEEQGYLYPMPIKDGIVDFKGEKQSFYDAFNEDARKLYWKQINEKLYSKKIDAWWLDASEPSILDNVTIDKQKELMQPTALGSSTQYFTAYPMLNSKAVYDGQRETNPEDRVFILTRSAFAGSQHYASAIWSGDIASRWEDLKAQIPAGLNMSLSGIPYWTTDIGGFCVEDRYRNAKEGSQDKEEWRELNTRWFQYGTFCPIFRLHGQFPHREIYNIAPSEHIAYKSMVYYAKLRYRLMPYIYSLAGRSYHEDYTIMRPLVMDFGDDVTTHNIPYQFMFGSSFMVCPIYEYRARSREVYFPKGANWYNYETGDYIEGGQTKNVDAPYERMPLFVKAGSIIPTGSDVQNTKQSQAERLTLEVYMGADGEFTLYEDEETNYNYEKGKFSNIKISYTEETRELIIHDIVGTFDNMLSNRSFHIVWKSTDGKSNKADVVNYSGKKVVVNNIK